MKLASYLVDGQSQYGVIQPNGDVIDLSKKIGVKNANVHVWFSSTGSKLPEIKKVGKGHYKIQEKKA
jgi:hypothetical protein